MRVLVLGSGGREHALCLALAADPAVSALICAPGNAGTATLADNRPVRVDDAGQVRALADAVAADLVVIGPEVPLVAGVADVLRAAGHRVFGPSGAAARLEGSKAFAKAVMDAAGVPTAGWCAATDVATALRALEAATPPYVVKDDGLAAGKGVVVTDDPAEARRHVEACLSRPGGRVVVEDYLDGPEVSLFAVVDEAGGVTPLLPAQDAKRVGDGDTGPNTGGMGAYAPLPWAPPDLVEQVRARVLEPTVAELARQGSPFSGLLYAGLALTSSGIRVVEFNCRFGDPETQAVLALLDTPLTALLGGSAPARWRPGAAVTVVLAAPGYPEQPRLGGRISGLERAAAVAGVSLAHAGTGERDGDVVATGGRVLSLTGTGPDLTAARMAAYEALAQIHLDGSHARSDIAAAAVAGRIRVPG